jgi:hypothetical protein
MLTDNELRELLEGTGVTTAPVPYLVELPKHAAQLALCVALLPPVVLVTLITILKIYL